MHLSSYYYKKCASFFPQRFPCHVTQWLRTVLSEGSLVGRLEDCVSVRELLRTLWDATRVLSLMLVISPQWPLVAFFSQQNFLGGGPACSHLSSSSSRITEISRPKSGSVMKKAWSLFFSSGLECWATNQLPLSCDRSRKRPLPIEATEDKEEEETTASS